MTIFKEIHDLLFNNDCVIVPKFGAFVLKSHSAYIKDDTFYPPRKVISFNAMLDENDGLLVKHLSTSRNISYKKALKTINDETQSLKNELSADKKIKIDQVFSSQWCRCKDTAKYAFGDFKEFSALNSTFSPPFDKNEKKQIRDLKNFVKNWNSKGKNLVLVTHYVVILELLGVGVESGEIIISNKNYEIIDRIVVN